MQVDKKKKENKPINIPLPNLALFIIVSLVFLVLMSANYKIMGALMRGTLEDTGTRVIVNLLILAGILAFGGWVYHIKWQKKAQLNTKSG